VPVPVRETGPISNVRLKVYELASRVIILAAFL